VTRLFDLNALQSLSFIKSLLEWREVIGAFGFRPNQIRKEMQKYQVFPGFAAPNIRKIQKRFSRELLEALTGAVVRKTTCSNNALFVITPATSLDTYFGARNLHDFWINYKRSEYSQRLLHEPTTRTAKHKACEICQCILYRIKNARTSLTF
jgi:hypothetical protein